MRYDDLYRHELEERERLRSAANITIGVLALIAGVLGSMISTADMGHGLLSTLLFMLSGGAAMAFSIGLYYLIRCYHGHKYKVMPSALECRDHRAALRRWHKAYGEGDVGADAEFQEWLDTAYATASDRNSQVNWARSACLYKANGATIWCVIFTLLAAVPHVIHRATDEPQVQRVEIVRVPETVPGSQNEDAMAEQKPEPPPPPKPEPPPLRDLREGQLPTSPRPPKE